MNAKKKFNHSEFLGEVLGEMGVMHVKFVSAMVGGRNFKTDGGTG